MFVGVCRHEKRPLRRFCALHVAPKELDLNTLLSAFMSRIGHHGGQGVLCGGIHRHRHAREQTQRPRVLTVYRVYAHTDGFGFTYTRAYAFKRSCSLRH